MRTGLLTDLILIAALAISSLMYSLLLPDHLEAEGLLLLALLMTLAILAMLRPVIRDATQAQAPRPVVHGDQRRRQVLAIAEDHTGSDEDRGTRTPISEPGLQQGQVEIRPGVWAFEGGVPLEILLPHLERRRRHHGPA